MEIGKKLKNARVQSGMTQENVAEKIIWAIIVNIIVVALLIALNMFIPDNRYFLVGIFCLMVITSSALLYQIIKKF